MVTLYIYKVRCNKHLRYSNVGLPKTYTMGPVIKYRGGGLAKTGGGSPIF